MSGSVKNNDMLSYLYNMLVKEKNPDNIAHIKSAISALHRAADGEREDDYKDSSSTEKNEKS